MAATAAELTSDSMAAPPAGILRAENKSPVAFVAGLKSTEEKRGLLVGRASRLPPFMPARDSLQPPKSAQRA
jgi:hypothetical protein